MRARRVLAALVAAGVVVGAGPAYHRLTTPAVVRDAAAALRLDSVVVTDPGTAPLDVDRARRVLGDRPVVVAVLPAGVDEGDACAAVVRAVPEVLAAVWAGGGSPYLCTGDDFPPPDEGTANALGSATDNWVFRLSIAAGAASEYRTEPGDPDLTPQVEELVLAFDAAVTEDMADGVPRRELAASPTSVLATAGTLLALVGLVAALLLGVVAGLAAARRRRRAALDRRRQRLELELELAAVADAVLRDGAELVPAPREADRAAARRRAEVAGRYVLTLTEVQTARTDDELAAAAATVAALRRDTDALADDAHRGRRPRRCPRRRWWSR